jgi:hypothetical protein
MKKLIQKEIFSKHYDGGWAIIRFKDLPDNLQPDDMIDIRREEAYYSENNSYDAYTELVVIREREETDDEYQRRIDKSKTEEERKRKMRYETYLKLKQEFENL